MGDSVFNHKNATRQAKGTKNNGLRDHRNKITRQRKTTLRNIGRKPAVGLMSWLLPIWQILPVNPDWQLHSKPSPVSVQIPPFLQGLPLQCELSVKRQNQKLNSRKINFPAVQLFDSKKKTKKKQRTTEISLKYLTWSAQFSFPWRWTFTDITVHKIKTTSIVPTRIGAAFIDIYHEKESQKPRLENVYFIKIL